MFTRLAATAALVGLLSLTAAHAQSHSPQACVDQLHQTDAHQTGHAISARILAIPPKAWQHYSKAVAAAAGNHPELAEQEAARALALAPAFAEVYLLRALAAANNHRPADALPLLATARALAPDLAWIRIATAGALNQLGRFDQALTELASTPGADAASWQAHYERARAEAGLGNLSAALHTSQLAIATAPVGCTEARLLHANILELAGRHRDVVAELETFLAEDRLMAHHTEIQATLDRLRSTLETESLEQARASATSSLDHSLLAMN